jgi:hypothetical protein
MSSELKLTNIKAKDGTAGISIADSTGNVSLSGSLSAGTIGGNVVFPAGSVVGVGHSGTVTTKTNFASTAKALNNFISFNYTLKSSNPYITIISNIMVYLSIGDSTVGCGHFVVSLKNSSGGTTAHQEMEDFDANMHRFYSTASGTHQLHQTMTGTTRKQLSAVLDVNGVTTAGTVIEVGIGVYRTGSLTTLETNEGVTNGSGTNFLLLEEKS